MLFLCMMIDIDLSDRLTWGRKLLALEFAVTKQRVFQTK